MVRWPFGMRTFFGGGGEGPVRHFVVTCVKGKDLSYLFLGFTK